jgi:hypothetical protein
MNSGRGYPLLKEVVKVPMTAQLGDFVYSSKVNDNALDEMI